MLPYTLDNHFTFGYGDGIFNPQDKGGENFYCKFSKASHQPMSFKEECEWTAMSIASEAHQLERVPYVMLSGGMDSEVVAKAFIGAEIPFKAITFRFANNKNVHETRFVDAFVKRHGIDHSYYDIDVLEWMKTEEAADIFQGSQCASFTLVPHMKLIDHIWFELNGLPVMGNGDIYLEKDNGKWRYVELEYMLAWYRHCIRRGILGAIGFFQHTPEIMLSMLYEPKIAQLGKNEDDYASKAYDTSRFVKYAVYRKHWPDLVIRPKFGGQEMVREEFKQRSLELLVGREHFNDKWWIDYEDLVSVMAFDETACPQHGAVPVPQTEPQTTTES